MAGIGEVDVSRRIDCDASRIEQRLGRIGPGRDADHGGDVAGREVDFANPVIAGVGNKNIAQVIDGHGRWLVERGIGGQAAVPVEIGRVGEGVFGVPAMVLILPSLVFTLRMT